MSGENESTVTYWQTKYNLLQDQFAQQKRRNEDLEDRLLDMVEKVETDKLTLASEIDSLTTKLEAANKTVNRLNGAVTRLKSKYGSDVDLYVEKSSEEDFTTDKTQCTEEPEDPIIIDRPKEKIVLTVRSKQVPDRGYHHFPVLALEEGLIFGFRWEKGAVVKVV